MKNIESLQDYWNYQLNYHLSAIATHTAAVKKILASQKIKSEPEPVRYPAEAIKISEAQVLQATEEIISQQQQQQQPTIQQPIQVFHNPTETQRIIKKRKKRRTPEQIRIDREVHKKLMKERAEQRKRDRLNAISR